MDDLRRDTRNIHQKGAYIYATVEDIKLGFATVRLSTNGARMTNLPVVGGPVLTGQRVAVDYSAGVPPVVRPVAEEQQPTVGLGLPEGPEVTSSPRRDHSCRLRLTSQTGISHDSWTTISWSEAEYQTDTFWAGGSPSNIELPMRGVYMFIVDLSWGSSHDHWDEVHQTGDGFTIGWRYDHEPLSVEVTSTTNGRVARYTDFPITSEPSIGKIMQMSGSHYGEAEEILQVKVYQRTRQSTMNLEPHFEEGQFLAPRVTVQWMSDKE
jgi:hypothetical protein